MDFLWREMQRYGYKKPVMIQEAQGAYLDEPEYPHDGHAIFQAIKQGDKRAIAAHNAELSVELIKMHVQLFANNVNSVVWFPFRDNYLTDAGFSESAFTIGGLLAINKDLSLDYKKPVYYTYQIMTSKLHNFTAVEEIAPNQYKFTFEDRPPVYVLWSNSNQVIDLSSEISSPNVKVTHLVTKLNFMKKPKYENQDIVSAKNIFTTDQPIFVEAVTTSK